MGQVGGEVSGVRDALLTAGLATRFAEAALTNISRAWPQRVDDVQLDADSPSDMRAQHPAFHGSFDWHSCVHMHWLLARLMFLFPDQPWEGRARQLLDERLSEACLDVELKYFESPGRQLFERPYGWAWLFKLLSELRALQSTLHQPRRWTDAVLPLAELLMARFQDYLEQLSHPVRAGTHGNTAFAMLLALDLHSPTLRTLIERSARSWYLGDRNYPAAYEPDGEDFLSGGLCEAALMSRLLPGAEFADWWEGFQPDAEGWLRWQTAVQPSSRSDGRLVHLAGLNLSRAWCLRLIARRQPSLREQLEGMAQLHLGASLPHVTGEDFAGDHWLASFATLALAPWD